LENRIPPPVVLVAVALGMWGGVRAAGASPFAGPAILALAGGVLVLAGLWLVVSGFREFRRAGTTIDPVNIDRAATLVSTGVFAWTRNPMYLGFASVLLGWAALLGSGWALIGPVLFVTFIQRFQIVPEERAMTAMFGAAFDAYRARVRRWI
jgi:protein-S-isoprenylcysteine O-methyltransferase Ste14